MGSSSHKLVSGRVPFAWRKLVIAGVIACAPAVTASVPATAAAAAQQLQSIDWSFATNGPAKDRSGVQLTVEARWGADNDSIWWARRGRFGLPL